MIAYVDTSTLIELIVEEERWGRAELIWLTADWVSAVNSAEQQGLHIANPVAA